MSATLSRKDRRRNRHLFMVIGYLHSIGPSFVLDIMRDTGISSGNVYVTLATLESTGEVTSEQVIVGFGLGRRLYRLSHEVKP